MNPAAVPTASAAAHTISPAVTPYRAPALARAFPESDGRNFYQHMAARGDLEAAQLRGGNRHGSGVVRLRIASRHRPATGLPPLPAGINDPDLACRSGWDAGDPEVHLGPPLPAGIADDSGDAGSRVGPSDHVRACTGRRVGGRLP